MTPEQEEDLQSQGFLFQKPKTTNLLTYAGAARNWPASRGIFHNEDKTALCWCNEEDHCRIISMSKDGNVKDVFKRFCSISDALGKSAEANGDKLMHSEKLGFLGTCPVRWRARECRPSERSERGVRTPAGGPVDLRTPRREGPPPSELIATNLKRL